MKNLIELYKHDRASAKVFVAMAVIEISLAVVMVVELVNILNQ